MPTGFSANVPGSRFHQFPTAWLPSKPWKRCEDALRIGVMRDVEILNAAADILIFAGQRTGLLVCDFVNLLEAGMNITQAADYLSEFNG